MTITTCIISIINENQYILLQELEAELKQDKTHLETLHEKKVNSVKAELDQERLDSHRRIQKLEQTVRYVCTERYRVYHFLHFKQTYLNVS